MMKRETFSKENIAGLEAIQVTNKTIVLPFEEDTYAELVKDKPAYKAFLHSHIKTHPELFPETIGEGWSCYGFTKDSVKQGIRVRRILTKADDEVWQIRPSFVMPYMTGYADDVEKALFLRKFAVPYWALTYVFGRNDMYWERLELSMGRNSIVGTTVKQPDKLPQDVLADEKHTRLNGEKAYIATTVGDDCVLGASIALQADTENLTEAYGHFKTEAQDFVADYEPQSVNIDGWKATWRPHCSSPRVPGASAWRRPSATLGSIPAESPSTSRLSETTRRACRTRSKGCWASIAATSAGGSWSW